MLYFKKIIIFIIAEYIAGILATIMLLLILMLIPSSYDQLEYLRMEELFLAPVIYSLFKVISGYYIYLFIFLKVAHKFYEKLKIKHLFVIAVIAAVSILILLSISSLHLHIEQDFDDWLKQFKYLSRSFFHPSKQWSLWVYSGFLTAIISPFVYKAYFLFSKAKAKTKPISNQKS